MSENEEQEEIQYIVDLGSIIVFAKDEEEAIEKACQMIEDCPRDIEIDMVSEL